MSGLISVQRSFRVTLLTTLQSLDDVDFTVLAATSVLGDLIDKCPPAEACRDAFDRMSKATVQMCMSTTGFGPQALRSLPQSQQHYPQTSHSPTATYTSASDTDGRSDADMQGYPRNTGYFSQQPHQRSRKPVPRFDMNLKDLFSDDETDKRSFSRVSNQVNTMRPPPAPIKPENTLAFTADLKISPQLRTQGFSFPTQTIPSPQQQPQQPFQSTTPTLSPPISQSPPHPLPSPYQLSPTLSYNAYAQPLSSSAYPDLGFHNDLDFLDSFPVQGPASSMADGAATQDVGIGFGMGFGDGTHDWSDGNGLDLFDGFFFGPGGTGM